MFCPRQGDQVDALHRAPVAIRVVMCRQLNLAGAEWSSMVACTIRSRTNGPYKLRYSPTVLWCRTPDNVTIRSISFFAFPLNTCRILCDDVARLDVDILAASRWMYFAMIAPPTRWLPNRVNPVSLGTLSVMKLPFLSGECPRGWITQHTYKGGACNGSALAHT